MARGGRRNADEVLAAALAGGLSVREAAKRAGVGERTAHRRLAEPSFATRVEELRSGFVSAALTKLEGSMGAAADALRELIDHNDPHVRIRAAVEVLRNAVRVRDQSELIERIRVLEEQRDQPTSPKVDRGLYNAMSRLPKEEREQLGALLEKLGSLPA